MKSRGTLYLVGTPIGNLADFTPRGKKALESADIVFCEDTRRFNNLVKGVEVNLQAKVFSFFKEKEAKATVRALDFLKKGKKVALVSDGGMPLFCDPGLKLIQACHVYDIKIVVVPGPSASLLTLVVSGFLFDTNMTIGYLPRKKSKIKKLFESCSKVSQMSNCKTFCFYESPYRLSKTLKILNNVLGNIPVFVAQELTKLNENYQLKPVVDLLKLYEEKKPKGEITVAFSLK
jgi:16S rRNA (cytidine1402-2'-O)-methyltransferase